MLQTADDKFLLTAADEQRAFKVLYNRYWEPLYRKALSRLGTSEDAQDAVQEVFISLWRNRSTIEIEDTLSPYLFTALRYCIIKRVYRKAKKGLQVPLSPEELGNVDHYAEELFEYKELQQIIGKEVSNLPSRMQEIYKLSRIEHLSSSEIASRLSISEQTVKNTLTITLKKLRVKLSHFTSLFSFFF
jgi:RNA polymerase sigma-70 factor (ECF subfamily)